MNLSVQTSFPLCVVLCLAACSGASTSSSSGGDAGAGVDGSSQVEDAGHSGDAGPEVRTGYIIMQSNLAPAGGRVVATFLPGGPAFRCPETAFGNCSYTACTQRLPVDPLPAPSSGTLSITGGSSSAFLMPLQDGTYDVQVLPGSLWAGGETLSVSSTGGTIPMFQGSITTPNAITVTAPAMPGNPWAVARTSDLVFTWTGGAQEDVIITFGSTETEDPTEVECHFPANAHTGTIPSAALHLLPAGQGYFSVASGFRNRITAGDWSVTLRAESDAHLPGNGLGAGGVVFQ